ncbi:MAG: U32 family peptidase [Bdellovibrionota bacterium]|nr:U32 family peptidase [Bdellovibrionota bacterium]
MKYSSFVEDVQQVKELKAAGFTELVLAASSLSRFGKTKDTDIQPIIDEAKANDLQVFIELDRILVGSELDLFLRHWQSLNLKNFDAVRVLDPGLLEYFCAETDLSVHFNSEMGNHNLSALKHWQNYSKEKIKRIILCPELEAEKIKEYTKELNCELEIYGFGKILLFYTPRHLLSPYFENHEDPAEKFVFNKEYIEILGNSEESPHKAFPLVETKCGSFMFSPKDLCVLDYWQDILECNLASLRFDLRDNFNKETLSSITKFLEEPEKKNLKTLKDTWPKTLIRGFFKANKSDVLFGNLKNVGNLKKEENYLGDVIETKSGVHLVIEIKSQNSLLSLGKKLSFLAPDKKAKEVEVKQMKNLAGELIEEASFGQFVMLPHYSGVSSNTRVYLV